MGSESPNCQGNPSGPRPQKLPRSQQQGFTKVEKVSFKAGLVNPLFLGRGGFQGSFEGGPARILLKLSLFQLSHEKNPALLSMKYWLVNRDPYFMVYYNPYISLGRKISSPISIIIGFLRGGCPREGVFLGNPEDSVWEDWGTLGKIRGITTRDP